MTETNPTPSAEELASMDDGETISYCGADARRWADALYAKFPDVGDRLDCDTMVTWFANAIETGSAKQTRQAEQAAVDETRNEIKAGLPSARETLAHIQNILAIGDNPDVEALIRDCLVDFRLGVAQAARADERRKTLESRFRLERLTVFKEVEAWCDEQAQGIGAVDGYDYRSGEEYAYRSAALHFKKAYDALTNESGEPGEAA